MTETQRSQFALTLAVLGVIALVLYAIGCTPVPAYPSRTVTDQHNSSVKISLGCVGMDDNDQPDVQRFEGTGVVVSAHIIVTANHMTVCPPWYVTLLAVDGGDGKPMAATIDVQVPRADLASLHVDGNLTQWFTPVIIGPKPKFGDRICEMSMVPRPTYRCGLVQGWHASAKDPENGDIIVDMFTEHGNSGSAVYDAQGRLVGITVMLFSCQGDHPCVGAVSSLTSRSWFVPPTVAEKTLPSR